MHKGIRVSLTLLFGGLTVASCRKPLTSNTPAPALLPEISQLLASLPEGISWSQLTPKVQAQFEALAQSQLRRDRVEWGLAGLNSKEDILLTHPSPAMLENVDRVLSTTFASELPDGFRLMRDVHNERLRRLLIRIYLDRKSVV